MIWNDIGVLVISGGSSPEAEVSRALGNAVEAALRIGFSNVTHSRFDWNGRRDLLLSRPGVVFPVLHGGQDEDGSFQGFRRPRNCLRWQWRDGLCFGHGQATLQDGLSCSKHPGHARYRVWPARRSGCHCRSGLENLWWRMRGQAHHSRFCSGALVLRDGNTIRCRTDLTSVTKSGRIGFLESSNSCTL